MANINAVITYNANLSPAQAQIKALTGQIGALSAAFNTLDKSAISAQRNLAAAFASNVGQIGGFTTQTVKATTAVENFGRQLASNRLTMRQYFREAFAGYTKQSSMMKQLAIQQVKFQQSVAVSTAAGQALMITPAQISAVSNATAIASQKFSIFNQLVDGGATKMLNWGKNTQWAGRQLMVGFTLPLALFTAAVSKQFRDLDKELTRFQKVYGQDLGNSVKNSTMAMRAQVEQLAFDIGKNYGIAAKDTAALAADIAATGAEGEKLLKSVQETTRLSVLGEVDRQEAMKATLALQSAFKMNTDELTESINFLNAVENQTSATLQDFSTAIPKVGPVVQSLGGDIQDLAMMLVAMREGGVPAAEAANAIKSGLASMINPTRKASEVAAEFGVNLKKIVEDNKGQLMPTIYEMQRALQGLDDFGRARVIEEIFGKYQFARMSALFENLGRMGSQTEAVLKLTANSSVELASIANAELKTLQESTAMKFQRSLEQLRNTLIPIGETLTETLIPIFEFIGQASAKFIEFFQALPEPVKNFAKYGTAIAALAGPVIMLVGLFGNLIANGIKFGLMLTRMGAKIAGLKVEKFELLNADVMAAKLGIDNLTGSFTTQEKALRQLTNAMAAYGSSLRTLQTTNPALFVPGAGKSPIKRATGSKRPEYVPGTGRGDHIPALLEPGEFIVNRNAASQFGPLLSAMNSGKVGRYQEGGLVRAHISAPGTVSLQDPATMAALRQISTGYARKLIDAMAQSGVQQMKVYSNLVLMLTESTNRLLTDSAAKEKLNKQEIKQHNQSLISQMRSQQAWQLMMDQTGLTFEQLQPFIREVTMELDKLGNELIDDPLLYEKVDVALTRLANAGNTAATRLQVISGQYGAFQTMSVGPEGTRAGRRQAFGPTTAGIPGYTQLKPGTIPKTPLHERVPTASLSQFFVSGMSRGAASVTRSSSPSKEADAAGEVTGRNIGLGAIQGLRRGLTQATQNKGPVPLTDPSSPIMQRLRGRAGRSNEIIPTPGPVAPRMSPVREGMDQAAAMRGQGAMNAMFMASMAVSSLSMLGVTSADASAKLGLFTTALMTATMAAQMFSGKNVAGNFLGLKSAGSALTQKGLNRVPAPFAPTAAGAKAAQGAGMLGKGAGGLLQAGSALSMLGGPVGIAAGLGITAAITGFMLYKNAAEEARKRAVAAFAEPAKTAEFFGTTLTDTVQQMKDLQTNMEDTQDIDTGLRDAVREDYATLIEKLRFSGAEAGARELSLAFNKMIASGLSEESAVAAVEAIAVESGAAGGEAFAIAYKQGMLEAKTPEEVAQNLANAFDPELMEKNSKEIEKTINELRNPLMGFAGNLAESFDNGFGDALTTLHSFQNNINPQMWLMRAGLNMAPEDHPVTQFFQGLIGAMTDQDAMKASIDVAANYSRGMEQLYANLAENLDVSSTQLVSAVETLFGTFKDAPTETLEAFRQIEETALSMENVEFDPAPIQDFLNTLDPLAAITLNPLIQDNEELAYQIMEGVTAGMSLQEILQAIQNGSLDAEIDIRVNTQEAINKVNDLKTALSEALGEDLKTKLDASDKTIQDFDKNIGRVERSLERGTEKMQENFEASQEASDAAIEALQEEVNAIQEKVDKRREDSQEKIDDLNKEKDLIQDSTDAYIKSIQKRQRADSFYANQKKSSLSALQRLASGDVFGFLQARTEMGQDAQQFSYDNQIKAIEDKRDAETKAIDDTIEKEQEKQKQYEKNQQDKIDLLNDQIDAERKLQEQQRKGFDKQLEDFKRLKEERIKDLRDARERETIKRQAIQKVIDAAANGQIISAEELSKTLGPKLAAPYIEQQKAIIKAVYLAEIAKEGGTSDKALNAVRPLYDLLYGNDDRGAVSNDQLLVWLRSIPTTENKAAGGYISGPGSSTSDSIPARLSDGEYVVKASSVKKYGVGMMNAINEQKYKDGGLVQLDKNLLESEGVSVKTARNAVKSIVSGGWPDNLVRLAYTIAMRESNGNPNAFTRYSPTNSDTGLFQINERAYGNQKWFDLNKLKDPIYNSSMAYKYVSRRGEFFLPWAMTPGFNGKTGWDWSYYADSEVFAPGSQARNETIRRTELFWNSFKGLNNKGNTNNKPGTGSKPGTPTGPLSSPNRSFGDPIGDRPISTSRVQFGKASPSFITGRIFPSVNQSEPGRKPGKPGKPEKETTSPGSANQAAVNYIKARVGEPYSYTADPPKTWDCSKLTAWSWAVATGGSPSKGYGDPNAKVKLPAYSHSQGPQLTKRVTGIKNGKISGLVPGDILYFAPNGVGVPPGHTSMYIGNGKIVEASSPEVGVRETTLNNPWNLGPGKFQYAGPPKGFAAGGFVAGFGGPRSDSIAARLSPGEYVMKAGAVDKYGRGFMDQINSGNLAMPSFGMPSSSSLSTSTIANSAYSNTMTSNNSSNNVKIVINGASGKSATAIANKVASMINSSNDRRNHSRSM